MKRLLTHIIPLTCLAVLCITLHSCTKTPDDPPKPKPPVNTECDTCLPPVTTTGKGTFGCKINGKIWLPKGGWGKPGTRLYYNNNVLTVIGYNDAKTESINISLYPITDTGYYDFVNNTLATSRVLFTPSQLKDEYEGNPVSIGYFHLLRFEPTTTGIISGTFAFDAYNANGDTVHVTEGRFDLRF